MARESRKPEEKRTDSPGTGHSLRDDAEEQLIRSPERSPGLDRQTPDQLIHELQVHQVELEIQAEELRRAQLALEDSRDRYLDLYDFAPVGYLTLSDKALITEVNLTGAILIGVERGSLLNARFSKFVAEKDSDEWHLFFMNVLNQKEKRTCTLMLKRGGGPMFPAQLEAILTSGRDGANTVRIAIIDITERKHAEDKLALASRKLSLLSSITRHDITNQLTVLTGFLKILEKKQTDPSLTGYFRKVKTAADRISSTIRFTREYEEIGVKAPAWQDCRTLVGTAEKEAQPGQVVVNNDLPAGIELFADPLIIKVFNNLIDNAVRHGGKITAIRFFAEEREGDHIVVCEDNGDGVAAGEKEEIFERGFGKNTGMGLFLSREILDITGILIKETGEPGNGARFEMTVPKGMWRIERKGT